MPEMNALLKLFNDGDRFPDRLEIGFREKIRNQTRPIPERFLKVLTESESEEELARGRRLQREPELDRQSMNDLKATRVMRISAARLEDRSDPETENEETECRR